MKVFRLVVLACALLPIAADAVLVLRQSTSRVVRLCGFVSITDGITPVTTLTLSGADEAEALRDNTATLDISSATFAAVTGADGCYSLTLDTTATNTVGELIIVVQDDSLVLPQRFSYQVVEEAIYDASLASGAVPGVDVVSIAGVSVSSTMATNWGSEYANKALTATGAANEATLFNNDGNSSTTFMSTWTANMAASATALGTAGSGLTSVPWNAAWDAEVQSEVNDALNAGITADGVINCEVNTANFAGSTTTLACILTTLSGGGITSATGKLTGKMIVVQSGAQIYEVRFINSTTWDGGNSELQLTLSRALPDTLADAVTVRIYQ